MFNAPHNIYWHLPLMIVLISLVYSGTRFDEWGSILLEAFRWGTRLFEFLVLVAGALFMVSLFC